MRTPSRKAVNIAFLAFGVGALLFLVRSVGFAQVWNEVTRVGHGFGWILLIELMSNVCSARGWYFTFTPDGRPGYLRVLLTSLASLSVAGLLPSGQAGEIAKANLLRGHAPASSIVSSLLLFNVLHVLVASAVSLVGIIIPLSIGAFHPAILWPLLAIAALVVAAMIGAGLLLRLNLLERVVEKLQKIPFRFIKPSRWMNGAAEIDTHLRELSSMDFLRSVFWLAMGRLWQVLEVWVILLYLRENSSIEVATAVFAATNLAAYLLLILPVREGFTEGRTFVVFQWLGLSGPAGLSLELIRRARKVTFQLLGVGWMLYLTRQKAPTLHNTNQAIQTP
jgi:hypothetical protein